MKMIQNEYADRIADKIIQTFGTAELKAAVEYLTRWRSLSHPIGTYDRYGRWYPDGVEQRPCCENICPPSQKWNYTLYNHCRTIKHCCQLYDADRYETRRIIKLLKTIQIELVATLKSRTLIEFIDRIRTAYVHMLNDMSLDIMDRLTTKLGLEIRWNEERVLAIIRGGI